MQAVIAWLLGALLIAASLPSAQALAAQSDMSEQLELEIYRKRWPELQQRIGQIEAKLANPAHQTLMGSGPTHAYDAYLARAYEQETRLRETQIRVFEWQIFAANAVLGLVALLVVSGIIFAGYQLLTAARTATVAPTSVDLEVSSQKVRLQSSVVGIVVLVISGIFLLLFLRDVYRIQVITRPGVRAEHSSTSITIPLPHSQ